MKYITIWYPTIFHKKLTLKTLRNDFRIDDDSDFHFKCILEFCKDTIDPEKHTIKCTCNITTGKEEKPDIFTVNLNKLDIRRNGFAIYSCDECEVPEKYRDAFFDESKLLKPIYHKIKEFYHTHEADKNKDSVLTARWSETPDSIDTIDNMPLIRFLENFERMFCESAEVISDHNSNLQIKINEHEQKDKYKLEKIIAETKNLNVLCENALIEYTFCKTLLTSIYNHSFKHNIEVDLPDKHDTKEEKSIKEQKIEYRRKALNIRNAVRYIENIKYKNQNRQTYILSEILEGGERLQKIGLILAYMGIAYAFLFGYREDMQTDGNNNIWWVIFSLIAIISGVFLFFNSKYLLKFINKKFRGLRE